MRDELFRRISALTDEEKLILSGGTFDRKVYSAENDFIINDKRLTKGERDIILRGHPRFGSFPAHRHTFAEMMIVFSGKITHRIGDVKITLTSGDVLLLNKHVNHSIDMTEAGDVGLNVIMSDKFADLLAPRLDGTVFSPLFKENARPDGRESYMCFRTGGVGEIENLTENLVAEFLEASPDEVIIKETLALILYYFAKKRDTLLDEYMGEGDKESIRRQEISSYIKNNYRSATLTELSERLYLSPPYLSKLITEYFGKSFKELLLLERIDRATEQFKFSSVPISTVIRNMGYENESYFHREYKKRTGLTPLAVRKTAKIGEKGKKSGDLT